MPTRERLRELLVPTITRSRPASPHSVAQPPPTVPPPTPSLQRVSPSPTPSASNAVAPTGSAPVRTPTRSRALEKAILSQLQKLPERERKAFEREIEALDEKILLSKIQEYDTEHKNESSFRPHAERLSKTLGLFKRLMGGVAVGIQADPVIAAPVVGALTVTINLGFQFSEFFTRLTDMVCEFQDYLEPLAEHSRRADNEVVERAVTNVYVNIIDFSWKARCVFVDANGERRRWTSFRAFIRQHWDTFETEFETIKREMQHHLDVLQHTVQATHFNAFRDTERRKERSAFLSWVSDIDFEEVHQTIYSKKHTGTGEWLTREPEFQQWMQSSHSSLLWCNGKPGIGKSVLSSNTLEHITVKAGLQKDTAICFAYYDYRDSRLANLSCIIAAFVKQLCQRKDSIPESLLQIMRDARSQSLIGSQAYFLSLVESFKEVFVLIDALDECPEHNRQEVLDFITTMVTMPASYRIKVFITSRRQQDITTAFEANHVPIIKISADKVAADIETFARSKVKEFRAKKLLHISREGLEEEIIDTLARQADGMFLWVNLQLDSLRQASARQRDRDVEEALKLLPSGLPATYVRILERIEGQHESMRDLALNCLAWTIYARRPLRIRELQHALAVSSGYTSLQDLQIDDLQIILEACGNLIEEVNNRIRPVHFTVQEFLTSPMKELSQSTLRMKLLNYISIQKQLGLTCLKYIHTMGFQGPAQDHDKLFRRVGDYPLASYACQYFDYHIVACDTTSAEVIDPVEKLFQLQSQSLAAVLQIRILQDKYGYFIIRERFHPMDFAISPSTIIYSTNLYHIASLRAKWLDQVPPPFALHLAASAGILSAVTRIIEGGCDIDGKDGNDNTALGYACLHGHLEIVHFLISKGGDVNIHSGTYGNALQTAVYTGHEKLVRILLDNGADINIQAGKYGSALHAAVARGYKEVVQILLKRGADVNRQGGHFGSALQAASAGGYKQIVQILLDKGADVDAWNGYYGSAIQAASGGGYVPIVKLLLDKGADVSAQGGYHGNALQVASYNGHMRTVKLLLDEGTDISAQGGYHGNALQAASCRGHMRIVKLLLDKGADINAQGGYYGNALQAASYKGHMHIVKLLLDKGTDINAQGGYYGNALQAASYNGHMRIVKLLLDEGADENEQGGRYGYALNAAAYRGNEEVLKLLISKRDVEQLQDQYGRTLLWWAAAGGRKKIVQTLIEHYDCDPRIADNFGRTPLWVARKKGFDAVSALLLDHSDPLDPARVILLGTNGWKYATCAVCTLYIDKDNCCFHCRDCLNGRWDICEDCKMRGALCMDQTHILVKGRYDEEGEFVEES